MPAVATSPIPGRTRGYRKKERTRRQLLAAGLRILAEKGAALTVSDVVVEAEVSNGTFYNYFVDREELVDALAEHLLLELAAKAAIETATRDPAMRFAIATGRVLKSAAADPTWGRVVLRLMNLHADVHRDVTRYLEDDLAAGFAQGRFDVEPEDAVLDQVTGLILMAIRRIVEGQAAGGYLSRVIEHALRALGTPAEEVEGIVREALER